MRSTAFSSIALIAMTMASTIVSPARAHPDSNVGAPVAPPVAGMGNPDQRDAAPLPVQTARRSERPAYGFQLPPAWMASEYLVDHRAFGLDRPARGFGWSYYHDDIVLTDQWGRVYDVAGPSIGPAYRGARARDGIVGGVAGAAVGAVAGNLIAGAGSRLAGSLIGGGVGALVGLAVEGAIVKKHRRGPRYDEWAGEWGHGRADWHGGHWSGYPSSTWQGQTCGCAETVTTTTVTFHGGGGYMVPREVVTYENVYAPAATKIRARAAASEKIRPRPLAPVEDGKVRERTRLHTKTY